MTRAAEFTAQANEGRPAPRAYFASQLAVPRFNGMVQALFGHAIGLPLQRVWNASAGDKAVNGGLYGVAVIAPDEPEDGHVFGVTSALTVTGNDGTISGAASETTTGAAKWFFRSDTSNWERVRDLGLDDDIYFPEDIVHGLGPMLALELLPIGYPGSDGIAEQAAIGRLKIAHRYAPRLTARLDAGLQSRGFGFDIATG